MDSTRNSPAKRRTRHLEQTIDKWLGEDAEEAILFLARVVKGEESMPARRPGDSEDSVSVALIPDVAPTIKERIAAAELLLAYRHGKPTERTEVSVETSQGPSSVSYASLSDEELAVLEGLTQKTLAAAQREVDAEFFEVLPSEATT